MQCSTLDVIKAPYVFQHCARTLPVRLQRPVSVRICSVITSDDRKLPHAQQGVGFLVRFAHEMNGPCAPLPHTGTAIGSAFWHSLLQCTTVCVPVCCARLALFCRAATVLRCNSAASGGCASVCLHPCDGQHKHLITTLLELATRTLHYQWHLAWKLASAGEL